MAAESYERGHPIIFFSKTAKWYYKDTMREIDGKRECIHCGKKPTKEGYDACLGVVSGAESVCCGHGNRGNKILK